MWAASSGHSTLGIPKSVGQEFAKADPGGHLPKRAKQAEGGTSKRPAPHIHIHLPPPPPILMMPHRAGGGFDTGVEEDIDPHMLSRPPIGGPDGEVLPPLPRSRMTEDRLPMDRPRPGPVTIEGSIARGGNAKEPPGGVLMFRRDIPLGRFAGGSVGHGVGGTATEPDTPPGAPLPGGPAGGPGGQPPKPMAVGGIPRLGGHVPHMDAPRGMGMEKLGLSTRSGAGGLGRFGSTALHFDYGGDVHEHMAGGGMDPPPVDYFEREAIRGGLAQEKFNYGTLPTASGGPMVSNKIMPVVNPKQPDPFVTTAGPWGTKNLPEVKGRPPQMPSDRPPPAKESQTAASGGVIHDQPIKHGMFPGDGGGRTDRLPSQVDVGSYVIPADVVSSLGQGTTGFGDKVLRAAIGDEHGHLASGGRPSSTSILAAPGEFCVSRAAVDAIGQRGHEQGFAKSGETITNTGHRLLDEMIARVRKFQIGWLRSAPPPKKAAGGAVMGLGFLPMAA